MPHRMFYLKKRIKCAEKAAVEECSKVIDYVRNISQSLIKSAIKGHNSTYASMSAQMDFSGSIDTATKKNILIFHLNNNCNKKLQI